MKINLLSPGHKMPEWVHDAFHTYNDRLPAHLKVNLVELPAVPRNKGLSVPQIKAQEAELFSKHMSGCFNVALDERGRQVDTQFVSKQVAAWQMNGQDVNVIVGGADGLHHDIKTAAQQCWSLSGLTFPHQLVRVIMAEQLYRAHTLLTNHPYHRE